jgi:hypothetical protein
VLRLERVELYPNLVEVDVEIELPIDESIARAPCVREEFPRFLRGAADPEDLVVAHFEQKIDEVASCKRVAA